MSENEMDLRDTLMRVARTYDQSAGSDAGVPAQDFLRSLGQIRLPLPAGLRAAGFGGKGVAALCPWIGVFDPDVSNDSREGLYLAYIFARDLRSVSLTLQQGVEGLGASFGKSGKLRNHLQRRAMRLQSSMLEEALAGWQRPLRLSARPQDWRPRAYESGSVAARRYETSDLPEERALRHDLWSAAEVLQEAARVERDLWLSDASDQVTVEYEKHERHAVRRDELDGFRPKDDGDYVVNIPTRTERRKRRHETLVREFGEYAKTRGFTPSTARHPKDIVLTASHGEWLVEAKVVKSGNPTKAVREAVGQLLEYRHFLCDRRKPPHALALFTEDIVVYANYLESMGVGSVWKTPDGWSGSPLAVAWGIVGPQHGE
jgi:5-methylcytosine-specific restriction enzyme MrcB-like protein